MVWRVDCSLRMVESSYSSIDLGLCVLIACDRNSWDSWLSGIRPGWNAMCLVARVRIDLAVDGWHGNAVILV